MLAGFPTLFVACFACSILLSAELILPQAVSAGIMPRLTVMAPLTADLQSPIRLALDEARNCYVADARKKAVIKLDSSGKVLQSIPTDDRPAGVAVTPDGNLIVSQGDSVVVFDASGKEIRKLGKGRGQFGMANGMVVDARGYIHVVDSLANCVYSFTPSGDLAGSFGSFGNGPGQFSMPTGMAYEKVSDQLVIADSNNRRIQFCDTNGNHIKTMGGKDTAPVQFTSPQGVAFEYSGDAAPKLRRIFVVDTFQGHVQVLDPAGEGSSLGYIGGYGMAAGLLLRPSDLLFDQSARRLIVSSGKGDLVQYGIDIVTHGMDTTPPMLSITRLNPKTDSSSQVIEGKAEAGAAVVVTVDNGVQAVAAIRLDDETWQSSIAGLLPGINNITVTARDAAGNLASQSATITYIQPPPLLAINQMPELTNSRNIMITGSADSGVSLVVRNATTGTVRALTLVDTAWSTPLFLEEGENRITVTAKRPSGGETVKNVSIILDETPPTLSMSALPDSSLSEWKIQNITGTVSDPNLHGVFINGAPAKIYEGLFSAAVSLKQGDNAITVRAYDRAGNFSIDSRVISLKDASQDLKIISPADGICTAANVITVTGHVAANSIVTVNGMQALMNGKKWSAVIPLSEGMNTLKVNAHDSQGNDTAQKRTVFLGYLKPELNILSPASDIATNIPSVVLSGKTESRNTTLTYSINSAEAIPVAVTDGAYSFQVQFPAEGNYGIVVTAVDGNGKTSRVVRTIIYDKTAPALTVDTAKISAAIISGTVSPDAVVSLSDGSGNSAAVNANEGFWTAGFGHDFDVATLVVVATDAAGNKTRISPLAKKKRK